MTNASEQAVPQPVEQLPIPLFDGVVLAARTHDGAIYLALRDLCAIFGIALRAQQRRIRANEALHLMPLRVLEGGEAIRSCWRMFNERFKLGTYTDLPAARFNEAIQFIKAQYHGLSDQEIDAAEQAGLEFD